MSNRESDRAQEMVDRIEEALAWEPGDPIYEEEYNSDWTGADTHMARMRCTDCQVDWPEPEEPCWSCGQPKPLLDPWWKLTVGDDRNTDERPPIQHFFIGPNIHRMGRVVDLETVSRQREHIILTMSVYNEGLTRAAQRAADQMETLRRGMMGVSARMVVLDEAYRFEAFDMFRLLNSYRNPAITPRRYGRSNFLEQLWLFDRHTPLEGRVIQTVTKEQVEQVPRTPKVFDFDLGLPKKTPTYLHNLWPDPDRIEEWSIEVPRHIPTKKQLLPPQYDSDPLMEVPLNLRLPDEVRTPISRSITTVRRSRYI